MHLTYTYSILIHICTHQPGRLPSGLLSARPAVTFPATGCRRPVGQYQIILLGDRGICVSRTWSELIASLGPGHFTTTHVTLKVI